MSLIAVTRFNEETWNSNKLWRELNNYSGCIYGCPVEIPDKVLPRTILYVLEMNNSNNTIEGIGLIINRKSNKIGQRTRVYENNSYNRYTYMSNYRIDKSEFTQSEKKFINILEILLFKGCKHIKRGQGITILSNWITNNVISKKNFNIFNYKVKLLLDNNIDPSIIDKFILSNGAFNYIKIIETIFIRKNITNYESILTSK